MNHLRFEISTLEERLNLTMRFTGDPMASPWSNSWSLASSSQHCLSLEVNTDLLGSGQFPLGEINFLLNDEDSAVGLSELLLRLPVSLHIKVRQEGHNVDLQVALESKAPAMLVASGTAAARSDTMIDLVADAHVMGPAWMDLHSVEFT